MLKNTLLILVGVVIVFALLSTLATHPTSPTVITATHSSSSVVSDSIVAPPSISPQFIDHVLQLAHSPAVGIGQHMYDLGKENHIDPAFTLAFFHHESGYGLHGVASETHSIGNIRCTPGWKCDASGGYRWYPTWEKGLADWYSLITTVYVGQGLTLISKIIPVYAPAGDNNDENAYLRSVMEDVGNYRQGRTGNE